MGKKIRVLVVMKSGAQFKLRLDSLNVTRDGGTVTSINWHGARRDAHPTFIDVEQIDAIITRSR